MFYRYFFKLTDIVLKINYLLDLNFYKIMIIHPKNKFG